MMFKNDYILDQIEMLGEFLKKLIRQESESISDVFNEDGSFSEEKFLKYRLKKMILEGKINEAENLLFEEIEKNPKFYNLDVAIYFYNELRKLDDKKLTLYHFSKEEIIEGIEDIKAIYKVVDEDK